MLPEYFHGMKVEGKKSLMGCNEEAQHVIISSVCQGDSQSVIHTTMSDMQILCVCVTLYNNHSQMIGMELP